MSAGRQLQLVADRFWALAHDSYTGRCHLHSDHFGLGLAGGLLAELLLEGFAVVSGDDILRPTQPHANYAVPTDPVAHRVLQLVRNEPRYQVRRWLEYLALDAREQIQGRLADTGALVAAGRRLRSRRWEAADPSAMSYEVPYLAQRLQQAVAAVAEADAEFRTGGRQSRARHSRAPAPEAGAADHHQVVVAAALEILSPTDVVLTALVDATDLVRSVERMTTLPLGMPPWLWDVMPVQYQQLVSSLHHAIGVSATGRR